MRDLRAILKPTSTKIIFTFILLSLVVIIYLVGNEKTPCFDFSPSIRIPGSEIPHMVNMVVRMYPYTTIPVIEHIDLIYAWDAAISPCPILDYRLFLVNVIRGGLAILALAIAYLLSCVLIIILQKKRINHEKLISYAIISIIILSLISIVKNISNFQTNNPPSPQPTMIPIPQAKLEQTAKEIFATRNNLPVDSVIIMNKGIGNYQYTGKKSYDFKLSDTSHKISGGIALDENGRELNSEKMALEEVNTRYQTEENMRIKYGKIDPELWEWLNSLPKEKPVWVFIVVDVPPRGPFPYQLGPNPTKDEYAKLDKDLLAFDKQYKEIINTTVEQVANKVRALGYTVKTGKGSQGIEAKLPSSVISELQTWEKIKNIYGVRPKFIQF